MTKKKLPLEKTIKDDIIAYLVANQFLAWVNNQGAMFGEYKGKKRKVKFSSMPGISDVQAVREGRAVFIEVKRKSGDSGSDEQQVFLQSVKRYGGFAFIATSIEDVYGELCGYFKMITPDDYYNQTRLHQKAIETSITK